MRPSRAGIVNQLMQLVPIVPNGHAAPIRLKIRNQLRVSSQILSRKRRTREPRVFTAKLAAKSVVPGARYAIMAGGKLAAKSVVAARSAIMAGRKLAARSVVAARSAIMAGGKLAASSVVAARSAIMAGGKLAAKSVGPAAPGEICIWMMWAQYRVVHE